jgi:hypothetical protein
MRLYETKFGTKELVRRSQRCDIECNMMPTVKLYEVSDGS